VGGALGWNRVNALARALLLAPVGLHATGVALRQTTNRLCCSCTTLVLGKALHHCCRRTALVWGKAHRHCCNRTALVWGKALHH
jgi:hypothetical protein